jgi:hypothetical protein
MQIATKKVLDEITSDDDLEKLVYTIIDACPYDFEFIPTIASFKYLSYFDLITQFNGVRYFYKTLIQRYEELNISNHNSSSTSQTSQLAIFCNDKHLFESCQINAIKIYKEYFFTHKNTSINDNVLAHSLNHILNEFFEESYTSKLKEKDINRAVKVRTCFMGVEVFCFY